MSDSIEKKPLAFNESYKTIHVKGIPLQQSKQHTHQPEIFAFRCYALSVVLVIDILMGAAVLLKIIQVKM